MPENKETEEKDIKRGKKEIFEFVLKIWTSVIVTVVGIYVTYQTNQISNSLKRNEVFEKLIDDLSTPDSANHLQRQIAFIALKELYKNRDSDDSLLIFISRLIFEQDTSSTMLSIAREIIKEKDTSKFNTIKDILTPKNDDDDISVLDSVYKLINISEKDKNDERYKSLLINMKDFSNKLTKIYKKTIVIYRSGKDKYNKHLKNADTSFKDVQIFYRDWEMPESKLNNKVFYFHYEDESFAKAVQVFFGKYLKTEKKNLKEINKGQIIIFFRG